VNSWLYVCFPCLIFPDLSCLKLKQERSQQGLQNSDCGSSRNSRYHQTPFGIYAQLFSWVPSWEFRCSDSSHPIPSSAQKLQVQPSTEFHFYPRKYFFQNIVRTPTIAWSTIRRVLPPVLFFRTPVLVQHFGLLTIADC
jgi:hypothetical protein